jgi:16S rRNA (guanine966-N2)-methyltransferase
MRVIAGAAKGRRLQVPRGRTIRPSGAKWRESAFGIVEHRMPIADAAVLDLYAGSGALGIEALSRGARSVVAVEQDRETARVLVRNASACGFEEKLEVLVEPVLAALGRLAGRRFDLVLLDPPYESGDIAAVLAKLDSKGLVAPSGLVVVEHGRRDVVTAPPSLSIELERRYGDSLLTLLRQRPGSLEIPVHVAS